MALLDKNILSLPGIKPTLGLLYAAACADALLIVTQALGLSICVEHLWKGLSLVNQLGWIALFAASFILRQALVWLKTRHLDKIAQQHASTLRRRLAERYYDVGLDLVRTHGSGTIATTLIEGVEQVRRYITLILPRVADLIVIPTVLAIALLILDPISGIIAIVIIPCIFFYMRLLGAFARENAARQHGEFRRMANHFTDTLRGISTIKSFGRGDATAEAVFSVSERFRHATVELLRTATISSLVLDLFRVFALAAVAIMLGFRLMAGTIELVPALAALVIIPELFAAVRRYSNDFHANLDGRNQLQSILDFLQDCDGGAVAHGDSLTDDDDSLSDDGGSAALADPPANSTASPTPTAAPTTIPTPAAPTLSLCGVGLTYPENDSSSQNTSHTNNNTSRTNNNTSRTDNNTSHTALSDISFNVAGPLKIGVIGQSGAGKSSLMKILAGFTAPTEGTIMAAAAQPGSQPNTAAQPTTNTAGSAAITTNLQSDAWRRRVSYIPQNPHVFHASLRDNVAFYYPSATDDEVRAAIAKAGLESLVNSLPAGLDTIIGEAGRGISGGQAQRIALARAFLDPGRDVLIFDEPTAHLDIETELALKETMLPLMRGRLVFFATHRLHWMNDMDYLIELENGHIVKEVSTHA